MNTISEQSKKLWLIANYVLSRMDHLGDPNENFDGPIEAALKQSGLRPVLENIASNVYIGGYSIEDMDTEEKENLLDLLAVIRLFNKDDDEKYATDVYVQHEFPESSKAKFMYADLSIEDDEAFNAQMEQLQENGEEFHPNSEIDEMIVALAGSLES